MVAYLTESPGLSAFVWDDGAVYHTYSTGARGAEFLMGYYPSLDQAPKGRDEGEGRESFDHALRHLAAAMAALEKGIGG